ncbi:MAG: AAA family ATPase [Myxococcota bacterium]|nr:AAA family ATPase [Myxococcota bacterium]
MRNFGSSNSNILIAGVDRTGMGQLREALGADAVLPPASLDYDQAYGEARRGRPSALIVGFDNDYEEAVRLGNELSSDMPNLTLVALSSGSDPDKIRAAMRAGYREYVVLPDDGDLLRQAVHEALYSAGDDAEDRGEIIVVCGAKGGAGCTTVAINLAAELCPIHRVVAVDLNFSMGDVASFLDLKPKRSIADLLADLDRLDERVLAGSVAVHKSKVHVIAQPNEIDEQEEIKGDSVLRLLQISAESYQYCMIDVGTALNEATLTTITVADMILLVASPDVPSIKNAWRRLQLFERIGIDRKRVRLVINRHEKRSQLSVSDIEGNLQTKVAAVIQNDWKTVSQAVNEGRLVREVNKKSPVASDISNMVSIVTDGDEFVEAANPEEKKGGALSWLFN